MIGSGGSVEGRDQQRGHNNGEGRELCTEEQHYPLGKDQHLPRRADLPTSAQGHQQSLPSQGQAGGLPCCVDTPTNQQQALLSLSLSFLLVK